MIYTFAHNIQIKQIIAGIDHLKLRDQVHLCRIYTNECTGILLHVHLKSKEWLLGCF